MRTAVEAEVKAIELEGGEWQTRLAMPNLTLNAVTLHVQTRTVSATTEGAHCTAC